MTLLFSLAFFGAMALLGPRYGVDTRDSLDNR